MSLLSGVKANRANVLIPLAIVMVLALPVSITFQPHVVAIGPTVVWAGSPDETLSPPPAPPPRKCAALKSVSQGTAEKLTPVDPKMSAARNTVSSRYLLGVLWRMYWATVRF